MFRKDLRTHERSPFVESLEYYVLVLDLRKLKKINEVAVTIDLSSKGMGILTNQPLEAGHVLTFKNNSIRNRASISNTAVVKWADRIDETTYRAGVKFT